MPHKVVFSPPARADLRSLYSYIADVAGPVRARAYLGRIETYCRSFADFPERGTKRDDLLPGLRVTGFERRLAIAFHVSKDTVTFDRILYGGRNLSTVFGPKDENH